VQQGDKKVVLLGDLSKRERVREKKTQSSCVDESAVLFKPKRLKQKREAQLWEVSWTKTKKKKEKKKKNG